MKNSFFFAFCVKFEKVNKNGKTMTYDFSHLSYEFTQWHDEQFEYYGKQLIEPESDGYTNYALSNHEKFIQELGFTKKEFEEMFLTPYLNLANKKLLTIDVLKKITDIQSKTIGHRKEALFSDETPLLFKVEHSSMNYLNALEWTVVNIGELRLPGFEFINGQYEIPPVFPIQQCHRCGKTGEDPRGYAFNNKLHYCHAVGCRNSSNPNPEVHKGCCYGIWGLAKKSFKQRLVRNYSYAKGIAQMFKDFCQERLEENLVIQQPVQRIGLEYEQKVHQTDP